MAPRKRAKTLFDEFIKFDDQLAARGVAPVGAWLRERLREWFDRYEHDPQTCPELWTCVGRGVGKSTLDYKLAVFFTVLGEFAIPQGERHWAVVISLLKEEAKKGIGVCSHYFRVLGVRHKVAGDTIELEDSPRGIRIVAASVGAASGWRAYFVALDEYSKFAMGDTVDDRDAAEIKASAIAMTATHARAPKIIGGTAWGQFGEFYENVVGGTDEHRVVIGPAASWVASDGRITEEWARNVERDARKRSREYGCEFQGSAEGALDVDALRACVDDDWMAA